MHMVEFQYGQEKTWGKVCDDMKAAVLSWARKMCHVQMAGFLSAAPFHPTIMMICGSVIRASFFAILTT